MLEKYTSVITKVFQKKAFKRAYFWLTLLLGVVALIIGKVPSLGVKPEWKDFFVTIGTILLVSGVFTSLVKTIQYLDIIKDELAKIIYDVDYLKSRGDLKKYWELVNEAMFGQKFTELSERIGNDIKEVYLPNRLQRYYRNYLFDITIRWHPEDKSYIEITQIVSVDIITNDTKNEKKLTYRNKLLKNKKAQKDLTAFEIEYWKVNSVTQPLVETAKSTPLAPEYEINLTGDKLYKLERKTRSVYSLEVDPFKSYIERNYLIDGMTIDLHYPEDFDITFWEIGTLDKFTNVNTTTPNRLIKKYEGLIYKNQGFRFYFKTAQ